MRWRGFSERSFQRCQAVSGYNCFGHLWASRRTCIPDQPACDIVLEDDGFRALRQGEDVQPGDIVLYWMGSVGLLHVAEVMWNHSDEQNSVGSNPWVLSKLDAFGPEIYHHLSDTTYHRHQAQYELRVEIRTERDRKSPW